MSLPTLLVRADANIGTGTGHVMRCLALAQSWQDAGGRALFCVSEIPQALEARLAQESVEVARISAPTGTGEDTLETIHLAQENGVSWIVADGYQFGSEYQRLVKTAGHKLLLVDDYGHASYYFADFVLNPNLSAKAEQYSNREPGTRVLLGPRYALLRREFSAWRNFERKIEPVARRVLVLMGGSDPDNVTAKIIGALELIGAELEASIVVGGSNPHFESLQAKAASSAQNLRLYRDVTNIPELMAQADMAISAAGSTCWELCLLGLPSLLVDIAANQKPVAEALDRSGCAIHLGDNTIPAQKIAEGLKQICASHDLRQRLSTNASRLVDGNGASRIVSLLRGSRSMRLRRALAGDSRLLWEWANDPEVRASSFSPAPIPWEEHQLWFADKISSPDWVIFIAEDESGSPIGQVRVDWRSEEEGEIDVSVARERRGAGYAASLVRLAVQKVFEERGRVLHALVKSTNLPSRRAFEKAGFTILGEENCFGHAVVHYVRTRQLAEAKEKNDVAGNAVGIAGTKNR